MPNCTSLSSLNDNELLNRVRELRRCERETTLDILLHLNEIERRKLHLKRGYSSLFVYCAEHLRYSESAAGRRVQAARCIARFPQVAAVLRSGEINLMTLGLVANLLTDQTVDQLLERIRGKTQREVEAIASTFRPPIRLRDRVQRVNVHEPAAPARPTAAPTPPQTPTPTTMFVNPVANSQTGSEKSPRVHRAPQSVGETSTSQEAPSCGKHARGQSEWRPEYDFGENARRCVRSRPRAMCVRRIKRPAMQ